MTLNYPYWRGLLDEGDMIPDGYGIAYCDFRYWPRVVIMPIPFNLLAGGWRAFVHWVQCPPWRFTEARLCRAYDNGYAEGAASMEGRHYCIGSR